MSSRWGRMQNHQSLAGFRGEGEKEKGWERIKDKTGEGKMGKEKREEEKAGIREAWSLPHKILDPPLYTDNGKHPNSPKVHYSEGSLVRRVRVRVGVKGCLYYIIFYYTFKTNTRQVRTSEPSD